MCCQCRILATYSKLGLVEKGGCAESALRDIKSAWLRRMFQKLLLNIEGPENVSL